MNSNEVLTYALSHFLFTDMNFDLGVVCIRDIRLRDRDYIVLLQRVCTHVSILPVMEVPLKVMFSL
jgi:hypothetical protein